MVLELDTKRIERPHTEAPEDIQDDREEIRHPTPLAECSSQRALLIFSLRILLAGA
jgi:hypothetical protein